VKGTERGRKKGRGVTPPPSKIPASAHADDTFSRSRPVDQLVSKNREYFFDVRYINDLLHVPQYCRVVMAFISCCLQCRQQRVNKSSHKGRVYTRGFISILSSCAIIVCPMQYSGNGQVHSRPSTCVGLLRELNVLEQCFTTLVLVTLYKCKKNLRV